MSDDIIPERIEYGDKELNREDLESDPMMVFREWMQAAVDAEVGEANAVCLCTADEAGHPDGRIVLLKGIEDEGLLFYTNYGSRKGRQLDQSPHATLVSWWEPLRRQVRISGRVEKCLPEESDAYFASRPRQSRLGAWASEQSAPVASREMLQERLNDVDERFGSEVPRPERWGGYRLVPSRFEFWQGRDSRLHDRFEYLADPNGGWLIRRLMP
jgi:pyridoxamine 5'-phosphate oxidase